MKRIVVGTPNDALLTTLELLLRHWGYRVLATTSPHRLEESLREMVPDLLLIASELLDDPKTSLYGAVARRAVDAGTPLVVLTAPKTPSLALPHQELPIPLDIFELFAILQQHLEKIPRRNLRLAVNLPGLLSRAGASQFAEILSLSSHGLFVKTALQVKVREVLHIILPLLGMKQEIEIECRVIYCVTPALGNNYLQGFGLEFNDSDPEKLRALQQFLENSLLDEVSKRDQELDHATEGVLQQRNATLTLRLPDHS